MTDTNGGERSCRYASRRDGEDESEDVGGIHYCVVLRKLSGNKW